jgi:hypothetical protein
VAIRNATAMRGAQALHHMQMGFHCLQARVNHSDTQKVDRIFVGYEQYRKKKK